MPNGNAKAHQNIQKPTWGPLQCHDASFASLGGEKGVAGTAGNSQTGNGDGTK